ncbi:MAG: long-chain fatty acid--CoA ligase, partial [Planctomycetes bacterium]|nr:long-chain fatty acid--CoA ligase [Planctomycetota bacterium]
AWLLCDQAIARAGLVSVPRGTDSSPAELRTIVEHSGARLVLLGRQIDLGLPGPGGRDADPSCICVVDLQEELDAWLERGRALAASADADERLARARPTPDDLCTIVYTSGTTGNPKGVMLTHANLVSNIDAVNATLAFPGRGTMLSILPSWHMFERVFEYVSISRCCCIVYTDTRRLTADLAEFRPDIVAFVPRIWELIAAGMQKKLDALPARKQRVVAAVRRIGRRALRTPRGSALRRFHGWLARKLLAPVHAALGGKIVLAVSGGGSLPEEVDRLLLEVGVPFLNGYGLTETSPVLTVRIPNGNRVGSIGPPLPGTDLRIVRDGRVVDGAEVVGEIQARGPQIMRGYYRDDQATRDVLTDDGWFSTGDLGSRDADGWFRITGRIKDTIVLAGGENVEPEPIECRLKTSPWIDQAMLVGQDRKVVGALLVVNPELCESELGRFDPKDEALAERLRTEIDGLLTLEAGFRKIDRVGPFCVMDRAFSVDDGTMTATLKLRRHVIAEQHAEVIDALYP